MNTTLTKKQEKEQEKDRARERILELLNQQEPKVFTILRKVSASGMSRQISLKIVKEGELYDITYSVAKLLDLPLVEGFNRAVRVNGCGMDMGFHLVYSLSAVLFKGQEIKVAHSHTRVTDAGYIIRQEWA